MPPDPRTSDVFGLEPAGARLRLQATDGEVAIEIENGRTKSVVTALLTPREAQRFAADLVRERASSERIDYGREVDGLSLTGNVMRVRRNGLDNERIVLAPEDGRTQRAARIIAMLAADLEA